MRGQRIALIRVRAPEPPAPEDEEDDEGFLSRILPGGDHDEDDERGIILSYEEKQAVEGKKRKQPVKVTRSYPFDEIVCTKEHLDFK